MSRRTIIFSSKSKYGYYWRNLHLESYKSRRCLKTYYPLKRGSYTNSQGVFYIPWYLKWRIFNPKSIR